MAQAILFDKDGVLFDFHASWGAWAQTTLGELAQGDPQRAALYASAIGYDWAGARFLPDSGAIAGTLGWIVDRLTEASALPRADVAAHLHRTTSAAAMVPTVPLGPLMAQLRARGLAVGVATNDAEGPARAQLARHDLLDSFDFIAGSDTGHGAKPDPGMILAFCAHVGLAPADVVMVGDSTHDMRAGQAAGTRTLGVLTGPAQAADLAPLAQVILPNIGHLPAWLDAGAPVGHFPRGLAEG